MLSLCPNFKKENVFRWEHSISFDLATGLLFESLVRNPVSFNPLIVWNEIQMRSKQGVYMGSGLLLPHARVKELSSPLLAFGVGINGVTSTSVPSNQTANLVCLVFSPASSPMAHTKVIARIASKVMDSEWLTSLLNSKTTTEIYERLV